ncbi:MAG: primosomal protein N' [Erysipelotrichaceae bacterium]|nr:primosomal protein N' [Erysipelotrichaceae bacterium]
MFLIEAYVTNAALSVNHPFTYYSRERIEPFVRIRVRFSGVFTYALVISCKEDLRTKEEFEEEAGYKLSPVLGVADETPVISKEQYDLSLWLSKTTLSPFISCLNAMLPKALKTGKKKQDAVKQKRIHVCPVNGKLTKRQEEVYASLRDGMLYKDARALSQSILAKFLDAGIVEVYEEERRYEEAQSEKTAFKKLTEDQEAVYERFLKTDKNVSLLYGVTGSGKTEVYLHLAREALSKGREVLILVPEISLTPQMIKRVKERFQEVVFYHSELSDQERYEQYQRIKEERGHIVVGTRSAVFLPFHDLGLIIIDEEHDSSYKQDSTPCYHVKNVAVKRALDHHGKVLLASATPSLDSYSRALRGDYELLKLEKRINLTLPEISIIDLNKEIRRNRDYIITKPMEEALRQCLDNNKQAIILLNRRGYSPIVKCSSCNTTLMCADCDIPLNYHKDLGLLKCHQCSRVYKVPKRCPKCGEDSLIYYGFGTKRAEEKLKELFPDARIERMDRDNVSKKGAHQEILERFERRETDILIGTQMIAKGLDYPDVTLVGILNADAGLMHQDYNAAKMTFDLLMQASGRSGRAADPGKVLIQAFNPDHYVLRSVLNQDYTYFYNIEMNYRHKADYPPYSHLVEIVLEDKDEKRLKESVRFVEEEVSALSYKHYRPYDLPKLQKYLRCRILLSERNLSSLLKDLHVVLEKYLKRRNPSKMRIDVDPLYLE